MTGLVPEKQEESEDYDQTADDFEDKRDQIDTQSQGKADPKGYQGALFHFLAPFCWWLMI